MRRAGDVGRAARTQARSPYGTLVRAPSESALSEPGEDLAAFARVERDDVPGVGLQREHRLEHRVRRRHPAQRSLGLVAAAPAAAGLVDVGPAEQFQFPYAHPGCFEHDERRLVLHVDRPVRGEHMVGGRWGDVAALASRQLHQRRADRVRLYRFVVEHHRGDRQRFPDRVALERHLGQLADEVVPDRCGEVTEGPVTEPGQ